jgi:hypothetical protein
MNKTAIKNFAIWARNKLIADISYRAGLMGITAAGIQKALPQSTGTTEFYDIGTAEPYSISGDAVKQRNHLVELIRRKEKETKYETAYKYVLEEVAYTWFNRLIAVRFMEVNDYLPSHIRVLSSDSGKMEPDLVTNPFSAGLSFTSEEEQVVYKMKQENKLDDVFRILFIKQCNALNENLPALFEKTSDYTELLLNLSIIDRDGVVYHLVHDIPEEDFDVERGGQVEIIGWLYQYYNTEPNEQVYDGSMSKERISKELLPAATTIYTPDWAIRYMTENSLGRLWIEGHPNDDLKAGWKYYLDEAEQEPEVQTKLSEVRVEYAKLNPEDIKVIDPCMGSGHILVYAFDVLMQIYEIAGYGQRDAARSILENNLYGLDIDDRAFQMAYFSIMMKARQYNRRILNGEYKLNVYSVQESNGINRNQLKYFGAKLNEFEKNIAISQILGLLDTFKDAKEYGSILTVDRYDWDLLYRFVSDNEVFGQMSMYTVGIDETAEQLKQMIDQGKVLSQKYHVTITNPPYLNSSRFSPKLDAYVKANYPDEKNDLSMIMLRRAMDGFSLNDYFISFITTSSWMVLASFEKTRKYMFNHLSISSLTDFGTELFEGKVGHNPIVAWVNRSTALNYNLTSIRLVEYCYSRRDEKESEFFNFHNRYTIRQKDFFRIPGAPVAYWISEAFYELFDEEALQTKIKYCEGLTTANNDLFLRLWTEVAFNNTSIKTEGGRWIPYNKGGEYRKWYGNRYYIVDWEGNGKKIKDYPGSSFRNALYQLREGGTYSALTSKSLSVRYTPAGCAFDSKGTTFFANNNDDLYDAIACMNSNVFGYLLKTVCATMDYRFGTIQKLPLLRVKNSSLVKRCINIVKDDWDSFEISWDFECHPLVKEGIVYSQKGSAAVTVEACYHIWSEECNNRFAQLKANEEELNRIFIDSYKLQHEINPEVNVDDVTVRRADLQRDIKSLLSYAVGCMFGRYSLGSTGITYAGGEWDERKYSYFVPDIDNVIPISDEEYLEDDIVSRLCTFMKVAFGEDTLEENLDYIAKALGNKGGSSREIIRNYFLNDFFKDHCQIYSVASSGKRPIYWLFDSGKQNGFKALIYLHRYNADTIGNLRIDYLHRMQRIYESEISRMQDMIDHSTSGREVAQATKRREKLTKQLKECREYDEKLAHLALSRIELDLDDGVKKNYRKIQTANDGKFYEVLADSKNIMSKE